jgi:DNA-binding Xre family transcriptional regulator
MSSRLVYKYGLKQRLDSLTHQEYKSAIRNIPKALQISQRTFYRYLNTRIDDNYSMPADHLARLARFLGCRIEDLLNYDPPPLSIHEPNLRNNHELAKKFKLVK